MDTRFPKLIKINVFYKGDLRVITAKSKEEMVVNEGIPFIMVLFFIFKTYPEIERIYPPGTIKLLLNDKPPQDFDIVEDGDEVELIALGKGVLFN